MHPRAFWLLAGLGLGTALLAACDRSSTAPRLAPARAGVIGATELQSAGESAPASAVAILPVVGGRMDLAAAPGYPVDCLLHVPAGALDGPTFFQLTHGSADAGVAVHVSSRSTEPHAEPQALGDDPILLSLIYAAPGGTQDVTVTFSPPDGSETVVARVSLSAGRVTTLGFRRGRSKYSVIYF